MLILAAIKGLHMELIDLRSKLEEVQNTVERIEQTSTMELMSESASSDEDSSDDTEWDLRSAQSAP